METNDPTSAPTAHSSHSANSPHALISVIVPIYNAEPYLELALLTIENQTRENLEIICVNDGSTDSSPETIRTHAIADERYVVIDKPNEGYGASCNRGIAEAHGSWIAIVEPDDWLDLAMYHDMLAFAATFDEPLDVVKTPYWRVWMPDTRSERIFPCSYKGLVTPPHQPFTIAETPELLRHHPSIWSALYRRDFLEEFAIRFPELPGASWADNPFHVETLCRARRIAYLDRPYYFYREETPTQYRALAETSALLPLERWHDMQDVLERIGCDDETVCEVQNRKAFVYIDRILAGRELDDELRATLASLFQRMDPDLVLADDTIPPRLRELFADISGLPRPSIDRVAYGTALIRQGIDQVRAGGLGAIAARLARR